MMHYLIYLVALLPHEESPRGHGFGRQLVRCAEGLGDMSRQIDDEWKAKMECGLSSNASH